MPAKGLGLHEIRTRVMCHLPVNSSQEEKAFFKVLTYIRGLKDERIGVTGFTISNSRPAAFQGWWWSDDWKKWVCDDQVLCFLDFHLAFDDPSLSEQVEKLKKTIRKWHRLHRSPQEEVWVVAYRIIRQD